MRGGYAFLMGVLTIGAVATATAVSLMVLAWAALQNSEVARQSRQSQFNADSCIEYALLELRKDSAYIGDEDIELQDGECTIYPIGGNGYNNRHICASGVSESTTRLVEVEVASLFPSVIISSWNDVSDITLCSS